MCHAGRFLCPPSCIYYVGLGSTECVLWKKPCQLGGKKYGGWERKGNYFQASPGVLQRWIQPKIYLYCFFPWKQVPVFADLSALFLLCIFEIVGSKLGIGEKGTISMFMIVDWQKWSAVMWGRWVWKTVKWLWGKHQQLHMHLNSISLNLWLRLPDSTAPELCVQMR